MIAEITEAWVNSTQPVVFSGAGMSTESRLPGFRSAQGLWKVKPESLATLETPLISIIERKDRSRELLYYTFLSGRSNLSCHK